MKLLQVPSDIMKILEETRRSTKGGVEGERDEGTRAKRGLSEIIFTTEHWSDSTNNPPPAPFLLSQPVLGGSGYHSYLG